MKATRTAWISGVVLGCLAVGCGSVQENSVKAQANGSTLATIEDDDEDGDENEEAVALSQVPEAIKQAALAAVPGFVLKSAEKETEEGTLCYCLEGTAGGEAVEVEVRASDAKVVEIERGEDDDED